MIYHDLDFGQYKKMDALNASKLKDFSTSPIYCKYRIDNPMNETPSMKFGTMVHKWILERDDFFSEYKVTGNEYKNKRLKAWKEEYADCLEREHKILLTKDEFEDLQTIDVEIKGENELTIKFEYMDTLCKSRLDSKVDNEIWDVKTSANPYKFERDIINFKYYIQAGFYCKAYHIEYGVWPSAFKFFVVPNVKPYNDFKIYVMNEEYIQYGLYIVDSLIPAYNRCKKKNNWPPMPSEEVFKPNFLI